MHTPGAAVSNNHAVLHAIKTMSDTWWPNVSGVWGVSLTCSAGIYSPTCQLRSSAAGLLVKPETSNKTSDRAFTVTAATAWNRRLPPKVRTATSTEQFSRALKTHLFTLDWSCGSPRRLWLVISADELRHRIQIEWLINWSVKTTSSASNVSGGYGVSLECSASITQNIIITFILAINKNTATLGILWRWPDMNAPNISADVWCYFLYNAQQLSCDSVTVICAYIIIKITHNTDSQTVG